MKRKNKILLAIVCIVLFAISWISAITLQSNAKKQEEILTKANIYMQDEIYVKAIPLLEEGASYNDKHTIECENLLKTAYLALIDQSGYKGKYEDLLDKQMSRKNADEQVYIEAAKYYFETAQEDDAFAALKKGIDKTQSQSIIDFYEDNRYMIEENGAIYDEVCFPANNTVSVKSFDKWGIASTNGELVIPCQYDKISNFAYDCAVVMLNGEVTAVNSDNNRVAKFHSKALDIGNIGDNIVSIKTDNGWMLTSTELKETEFIFEDVGTFSNGLAAACQDGKWGVIDSSGEWVIPNKYKSIVLDELGRCYLKDRLFIEKSDGFYLYSKKEQIAGPFDNVKPFIDSLAAVKQNNKWGFIDINGDVKIDYQFENAKSFSGHLAAVFDGDLWGYISLNGEMVIEPNYLDAYNFVNGSAAVKISDCWKFITLVEYKEGASL